MKKRIAVLIDAENPTLPLLDKVFQRLQKHGEIILARAYGDFTSRNLASWRNACLQHRIQICHHFACKSHKNSSDIFLSIDAMDILHQQNIDIFCLVSSDSDFSSLIQRLQNAGKTVIGAGAMPNAEYQKLCDEFFHLNSETDEDAKTEPTLSAKKINKPSLLQQGLQCLKQLLPSKPTTIPTPAKKQQTSQTQLTPEQKLIQSIYQKCQPYLTADGYLALSRFQNQLPEAERQRIKQEYKTLGKWVNKSPNFHVRTENGKTEPFIKPSF
ncbi:MAG: NYN domain-containing protein [Neisseria sp.]|nr:NYN domain-containing protein [Neisseria sp.]